MSDPAYHARSSARKNGGIPEDYIDIHKWFDATKQTFCDNRHRAILHNSFGIELCIQFFGDSLGMFTRASDGVKLPVRYIGEQHVFEDYGFIPTIQEWLEKIPLEEWMSKGARKLSKEFEQEENNE